MPVMRPVAESNVTLTAPLLSVTEPFLLPTAALGRCEAGTRAPCMRDAALPVK